MFHPLPGLHILYCALPQGMPCLMNTEGLAATRAATHTETSSHSPHTKTHRHTHIHRHTAEGAFILIYVMHLPSMPCHMSISTVEIETWLSVSFRSACSRAPSIRCLISEIYDQTPPSGALRESYICHRQTGGKRHLELTGVRVYLCSCKLACEGKGLL